MVLCRGPRGAVRPERFRQLPGSGAFPQSADFRSAGEAGYPAAFRFEAHRKGKRLLEVGKQDDYERSGNSSVHRPRIPEEDDGLRQGFHRLFQHGASQCFVHDDERFSPGLERIIHKIDTFRKEVVDIVRSDERETMICELNIQFFPLSKELENTPKCLCRGVNTVKEGENDEV